VLRKKGKKGRKEGGRKEGKKEKESEKENPTSFCGSLLFVDSIQFISFTSVGKNMRFQCCSDDSPNYRGGSRYNDIKDESPGPLCQ
jgi:hypothetical protein